MSHTIYRSSVMHQRLFPQRYRFVYRVFSLLFDIDRLDHLSKKSRFISHNRWNLFSFHDCDHGARDGSPLRPWLERQLDHFGILLDGGKVQLLCFPRILGYTFNPLSLWFCYHANGELRAILCEVSNTFGESHSYLLADNNHNLPDPVRMSRNKCFHVSPFIGMQADYRFIIHRPNEKIGVIINEYQNDELMLVATQNGERVELTSMNLLRESLRVPMVTAKVMLMIHWQALKIWLRGGRHHSKPEPPKEDVTA